MEITSQPSGIPKNRDLKNRIPGYSLYGNRFDGKEKWFVSIEKLASRCEDRGWIIDPHRHPNFAQLVISLEGSGSCNLDGQSLDFSSPSAMIIPVQCIHSFRYTENVDGWVITIENAYLEQVNQCLSELSELWSSARMIHLPDEAELVETIKKMEQELTNKDVGHFIAIEAHLVSIFLLLLRHQKSKAQPSPARTNPHAKLVREFQNLIEQNYRENWKLDDFASALNASITQLRSACEHICGLPPMKMLHERRLTEAKRSLIFDETCIARIAYSLGFSSPAYFARYFKNETGISASDFRKNGRGKVS